jgi:hypothetical protein
LDHKINEDILDKLKMKTVIDYIENYQRKWNMYTERIQEQSRTKFTLSARATKINKMSNEEMGGKYEAVTGHLA